MVDRRGRVKLTDFGIARLRDDSKLTMTGQVLGSPQYMSPEQASSLAVPESDLWGLGATLYFAVEGRPPFERGNALSTLHAVVTEDLAVPEAAGPLAPVIESLLRKEPSERPPIEEVREMLAAVESAPAEADGDAPFSTADLFADPSLQPAPVAETDAEPLEEPAPAAMEPAESWPFEARDDGEAEPPPERKRSAVPLIVGLLLLALGLSAAWLLFAGGDPESESTTPATRATDGGRARGGGEKKAEVPADDAAASASVPADWVTYQDPDVGYSISHPPEWQVVQRDDTRTDFRDPETGAYVRVDWTDTPGPSALGAWEDYAPKFAAEHDGYQELRMEEVDYRGYDAAEWEFTFGSGGSRLQVLDLGFVTGDYGFALLLQTPEEDWEAYTETFEAFKASFQPPA